MGKNTKSGERNRQNLVSALQVNGIKITTMKNLILSVLVLFFAISASAQHSNVHWGIKGGINMADLADDATDETDGIIGFHIGGLAHIHINKSFAIQPELLFSAQGAEYGDAKLKVNYITVPVLGQYMFNNGFRLQTGPQIGILTSAEVSDDDVDIDIDDEVESFDFSWTFGASYLTSKGLGFDARYNLGLSNIRENGPELKNRVWQFGLFYQFSR
jgi:hypothetical protein